MTLKQFTSFSSVLLYILFFLLYFPSVCEAIKHNNAHIKEKITSTELLADNDEETLLVSTLDGALHAISKSSGVLKWTLKDGIIEFFDLCHNLKPHTPLRKLIDVVQGLLI